MIRLPKLGKKKKKNIKHRKFLFFLACKCLRWGDDLSCFCLAQEQDKLHCASTWTICLKAHLESSFLTFTLNFKSPRANLKETM